MARLKEVRTERGMSQAKLAKLINSYQQAVANWENGIKKPTAETIVALSRALAVSADYLLGLENYDGTKNY